MSMRRNPWDEAAALVDGLDPALTTRAQVLAILRQRAEQAEATWESLTQRATCRCGAAIESLDGAPWVHTDSSRSRGCRAATFTSADGWDDNVPRTWTAQPSKAGGQLADQALPR